MIAPFRASSVENFVESYMFTFPSSLPDEACGAYRRILTPVLVTRNLTGEIEHQMEQIKRDLASHFVEGSSKFGLVACSSQR